MLRSLITTGRRSGSDWAKSATGGRAEPVQRDLTLPSGSPNPLRTAEMSQALLCINLCWHNKNIGQRDLFLCAQIWKCSVCQDNGYVGTWVIIPYILSVCFCFPIALQYPCPSWAMLPGYGFSPLLDFQPHLQAFHCRGESSDMWFPGSVEAQALSDSREGRPLLRQHQHIAVCQQETLAFIDLQQPSINGFQSCTPESCSSSLCSKPVRCNGNSPSDFAKNGSTDTTLDNYLTQDSNNVEVVQDQTWTPITGLPETVYEKPEPGVKSLSSRDLFLPLSPTYAPEDRNSLESQQLSSPSSPLEFQSPDPFRPQRRTSLGSIKEKSISKCHFHLTKSWHIGPTFLF